jgi:hypothetical protein
MIGPYSVGGVGGGERIYGTPFGWRDEDNNIVPETEERTAGVTAGRVAVMFDLDRVVVGTVGVEHWDVVRGPLAAAINIEAGGGGMVDLVRWGRTNWP